MTRVETALGFAERSARLAIVEGQRAYSHGELPPRLRLSGYYLARAKQGLAVAAIEGAGFTVRFVEYCEDARTPGLLGQIAGVTDWGRREVKIATKNRSTAEIAATLAHERRHVEDPSWDCGNRDVFGRGGRG